MDLNKIHKSLNKFYKIKKKVTFTFDIDSDESINSREKNNKDLHRKQ